MDENLLYTNLLEILDEATPSTWVKQAVPVYETQRNDLSPPLPGVRYSNSRRVISHRIVKQPVRTRPFNEANVKAFFPNQVNYKRLTLDNLRTERLNQVRATFTTAIAALILGILLVFTGVVLAFTVNLSLGIITTVSSVVTGITSSLAFKFHANANSDLNKIINQLIIVEQTSG